MATTPRDSGNDDGDNIERIQAECSQMIAALKHLEEEEKDLHYQLEILAREALLCGFQPDVVEKVSKRRKPVANKKGKGD
mmetsp:Transcript_26063/g.46184  ORF Transcript_26063/g.46184 Transcript_26063/m.46184 type:complete len:80 (-) Transcript_26063:298-537(-)